MGEGYSESQLRFSLPQTHNRSTMLDLDAKNINAQLKYTIEFCKGTKIMIHKLLFNLYPGLPVVVVSHKGVKCSHLHPTCAHFFCCGSTTETADVGTNEWDAKKPKHHDG